ncbi:hypothetical protein ACWGIU_07455 [Streptomyces sp. NPDC054840]
MDGRSVGPIARCGEGLVVVDRVLKALGAAHEGSVGVLLADGSEPGPVYFDVGSGSYVPRTDGRG